VVEPPKYYGPHAPVIVSKTSDDYACVPQNLRSLSSVLGKPKSSTILPSRITLQRHCIITIVYIQITSE
jgi:ABC-type phosphate transport system permease subunit